MCAHVVHGVGMRCICWRASDSLLDFGGRRRPRGVDRGAEDLPTAGDVVHQPVENEERKLAKRMKNMMLITIPKSLGR